MTLAAASRSVWYSRSESVIAGAQQTESPVCTPIGSRFSIEQTMTTLSSRSRMTSSSNSPQPSTDSSTSTCEIGLSLRPRSTIASSSSARAREAAAVAAERERRADRDRQLQLAARSRRAPPRACARSPSAARAGRPRPSPRRTPRGPRRCGSPCAEAPISSIPSSSSTPARSSSIARLSAVWPPSVGSSASGRSRAQHAGHALEVERLEVGRVGPVRVGHDRGRVRVDRGPCGSPPRAAP